MRARSSILLLAALGSFGATAAGCAHTPPPEPLRVKMTELGTLDESQVAAGRPIIIEIPEGAVIPFDVTVGGDLVSSPPGASIPLTAKRTFWIRITKKGLEMSRDGEHFGVKPRVPGRFRLGVSATRARGVRAEAEIVTPQP